jgi:hypothetical protein
VDGRDESGHRRAHDRRTCVVRRGEHHDGRGPEDDGRQGVPLMSDGHADFVRESLRWMVERLWASRCRS